jgi:putative PIN family toxin of toxin-antitoxin system
MYVFDTSIFVAGLRSQKGASFVLLKAIRDRLIEGAASTALLLEYVDVLSRDENLQNFWLSPAEVHLFLGVIVLQLKPVLIDFSWRPQLSDANDEMVLECAINARASAIVTFNTRDFLPAATQFGIPLIEPGALVRSLRLTERLSQ